MDRDQETSPKKTRRGVKPGQANMPQPHGGAIGNPGLVITNEMRTKVRQFAKAFPLQGEQHIAVLMGMSRMSLRKHFAEELAIGRAEMLASVGAQMVNRAIDADARDSQGKLIAKGDIEAQKYVLARLGGWTTKVEMTGKEGGPIEVVDLSSLSDEQLEDYGRLCAAAEAHDPE